MKITPKLLAIGALASVIASPLGAQGNGATLLAKVKKPSTAYNDIWGYTAPNGDEYALVGTTNGTLFYDCTDPSNPVEVGFISGPGSTWRDMKTYGQYAYIVTEGGGGVQIVDLSNPNNPTLVKTWGTNWWGNAHNIAMDEGEGKAYVCGTNNGMRVIDVAANATSPPLVATYTQDYVHDLHVQNGFAHLAEIYDGRYRLVSVANLPSFPTRDSVLTPGLFTHNTWANATDTLCVTTDESGGGHIAVYDISNKTNIFMTDEFSVASNSIVHNAYFVGDILHMSWYTEGYVAVDCSDPANLTFMGQYDTSAYTAGSGYHGAWGCYPYSPSGVIYISDIEEGFHILRLDGQAFSMDHVALDNTENETGPYTATATVEALQPGASTQSVTLTYRVDGGSWQNVNMTPTGGQDEWSGGIPGQTGPAIVEYYILATDNQANTSWLPGGANPGDDTYQFAIGKIVQRYFNDFEGATDEGWTHGLIATQDDWQRGTPQGASGVSNRHEGLTWMDPSSAYSGSNVWANDLGNSGWNGSYASNTFNWLESPAIDMSTSTNSTLIFQRWLTVEGAPYDHARILVNGNVIWQNPLGFGGDAFNIVDVNWRQQVFDISSIADGNSNVVVRFEMESDEVLEAGGWNIDDVKLVSLEPTSSTDVMLAGDTSGVVGGTVSYTISSAPINSTYWIYYALNLNGTIINGTQFEIGTPFFEATTGTTSGAGTANWTSGPIPPKGGGRTVYLEARVDSLGTTFDSNVVVLNIQ